MATGTVTAGNSTTLSLSVDQTVLITTVHNTVGRVRFTAPQTDGAPPSDAGSGIGFGPLATSKTFGPFGQVGTLTITCESGTVTYTSSDSFIGNNLGVGVTVANWSGIYRAIDIGAYGHIGQTSTAFEFATNGYFSAATSGWVFQNTGPAGIYRQDSGVHSWFSAPSGTAGTNIGTWVNTMTLDVPGNLTINGSGAGIGYGTGAGGTVTQTTSKLTAVTLNKTTGKITTFNDSLAAGSSATFVVNNTAVGANDVSIANLTSGAANAANYDVRTFYTAAGSFGIRITNVSAGALAEALVINFAIIRGSNA